MAVSSAGDKLKFSLWSSSVSEGFWHALADMKLDSLHLDDNPLQIRGFFAPAPHEHYLQLRCESFPSANGDGQIEFHLKHGNPNQCFAPGTLYNSNTLEKFRTLNKRELMKKEAEKIWDDILSGHAFEDCTVLNRFFIISFADLKKWQFHYWFAFPALVLQPSAMCSRLQPASQVLQGEVNRQIQGARQPTEVVACLWQLPIFTMGLQGEAALMACRRWRESPQFKACPFFLLHMDGSSVQARPLTRWSDCQQDGKVMLAFYDPSQDLKFPGWPLRNLLILAAIKWRCRNISIFCYRERKGEVDFGRCLIGDITIPDLESRTEVPEAVGWEYNVQQKGPPKLVHKIVDLASSMDPMRLAQDAAGLNLRLMRWRLLPSLNMDLLSKTKCLLLGAGTLGCQVARGLMAWGIKHITFVDYGNVAMSNPVRQSLYNFDHCLNGGRAKAEAAAESLRCILPGVDATGIGLSIPMPGHSVSESEVMDVMKSCNRLHELVDEHDIIFLLTDTRESRWLPTLLCANANKIAVNAALGFDTYLVMRHGAGPRREGTDSENREGFSENIDRESEKMRLGCYFCNDVVAPEDSTVNRTLDQQCTVTRPGAAPIAAALAVELAVSLLHHPLKINAPADKVDSAIEQPLGILPHQIRGFMANFSQMIIVGSAFSKCTACSADIIGEYRRSGFSFLIRVFNNPSFLEDLTGLTDLLSATQQVSIEWEDDEDSFNAL